MDLAYPYQTNAQGRTAITDAATHVRDLIEEVLFTAPGERVMRPDFGCGAARLVFAPNGVELASAASMLIQASLQKWLNSLIVVQGVDVEADGSTLTITVAYALRATGQIEQQQFQRSVGASS
jgi:phage baseplate assembly protein W